MVSLSSVEIVRERGIAVGLYEFLSSYWLWTIVSLFEAKWLIGIRWPGPHLTIILIKRFATISRSIRQRQGECPAFVNYVMIFVFHSKKNAAAKKTMVAIQIAHLANLFVPIVLHSVATKKLIPPSMIKL